MNDEVKERIAYLEKTKISGHPLKLMLISGSIFAGAVLLKGMGKLADFTRDSGIPIWCIVLGIFFLGALAPLPLLLHDRFKTASPNVAVVVLWMGIAFCGVLGACILAVLIV